ncbi:NDP-sugar synthase [Candidatus Aminicenantes bacterium AC-335-K20]|jgi:NDP-sugar pyrophosphorylase family protein|nr:NDP-sugar synthase [SCandidatus Aminicenantes bacterium Aminicenantia_JdfR_composite]MCP2596406.1 NDP-sugar synthase [Candidatus Aminicenantes bacterium AC-335-G13]MCP2606199.1 NDP-sugar synthase [Candidatus Aminicenantes bacterium AC-708-I09]MCP2618216.1 NDP-sugar synthase [Candidatus Aminicenantes bacterium AC-335-A11]MCP2619476.1 NDP-sugar synthase [Candidatus Aminicenantes bacterium AC-335-K20]
MKALILSAGKGERLKPLTNFLAKPAIPFHNKPIIVHILENLKEKGIKDVAINLHHLPDTIRNVVKQFKDINIIFSYEDKLVGSAGAIKNFEEFFKKEKNFLVINGDTIQHIPIKTFLNFHIKEKAFATLMIRKNFLPKKYTPIEINKEKEIISIGKCKKEIPYFMYCGAMILSSEILNFIEPNIYSDIFRNVFPILFNERKKIKAFEYKGPWIEIGTLSDYFRYSLNISGKKENIIDMNSKIHSSAKVSKSIIGKDSFIKKNVNIKKSIIWDRVVIEDNSIIENSILTNNVRIPFSSEIKNKIVFLEVDEIKSCHLNLK